MKLVLAFAALFLAAGIAPAFGEERTFVGRWKTTNRKLDGTITCIVKETAPERWSGRFYGVWQGVPFDYTVPFTGSPESLKGTATIDGASYTWTGAMAPRLESDPNSAPTFKASFGGNRYLGSFELEEKPVRTASAGRRPVSAER